MPEEGVEPTRPCDQRILSPPRLPFRHSGLLGFYTTLGACQRFAHDSLSGYLPSVKNPENRGGIFIASRPCFGRIKKRDPELLGFSRASQACTLHKNMADNRATTPTETAEVARVDI